MAGPYTPRHRQASRHRGEAAGDTRVSTYRLDETMVADGPASRRAERQVRANLGVAQAVARAQQNTKGQAGTASGPGRDEGLAGG